jgi:hypothetical protein
MAFTYNIIIIIKVGAIWRCVSPIVSYNGDKIIIAFTTLYTRTYSIGLLHQFSGVPFSSKITNLLSKDCTSLVRLMEFTT